MSTKTTNPVTPTESELRILQVLWNHSPAAGLTVREVLEHLGSDVGYTTVLKLLQIAFCRIEFVQLLCALK